MSAIEPYAGNTSPFDAIKLPGERWSARDLMSMLGYDRWENFTAAIERAIVAARLELDDKLPSVPRLASIARVLGFSLDDLIAEEVA